VVITSDTWLALRSSLEETAQKMAHMVEHADRPGARATKRWTVMETAVHTATVAAIDAATVDLSSASPAIAGLIDLLGNANVEAVGPLNALTLRYFTDREPAAVADLLRSQVAQLLRVTADHDPSSTIDWIGGSRLTPPGVLSHLLNELLIHGWDIAHALGVPWSMSASESAAFFDHFLVGLATTGHGHLLDTDRPPAPGPIAVRFRSRTSGAVTLVLRDGRLTVGEPTDAVDVRISYDPVTFNLMLFGRVSKAKAILSGNVLIVGGRRPWLLPKFLQTVRVPS
jgi:hypothetical protein